MTITEAIKRLQEIHDRYGDLQIIGGYMTDDRPLDKIIVVDYDGCEVLPTPQKGLKSGSKSKIEGVFLS